MWSSTVSLCGEHGHTCLVCQYLLWGLLPYSRPSFCRLSSMIQKPNICICNIIFLKKKCSFSSTGLNDLAKNHEIDKSISLIQASKSQKRDFRDFFGAKVCSSNRNVKFENFMHIE